MSTSAKALLRGHRRRKLPSTPSTTPNSAIYSSLSKQVFLHDWWLIKPDSGSHGKQLCIGGFTFKESRGIRRFSSAPVVKRHDAVTLVTVDGTTISLHGQLNRSFTLENGFSHEVCNDFLIGFPYYWEEFDASVSEEPAKGLSSDAHKMPEPGDHGTNMLNRNIDDTMQTNYDDAFPCCGAPSASENASPRENLVSAPDETPLIHIEVKAERKRKGSCNVEGVARNGPLTRSRTLLANKN